MLRAIAWMIVATSTIATMTSSGRRLSSCWIGGMPWSIPRATSRGIDSRAAFSTTTATARSLTSLR